MAPPIIVMVRLTTSVRIPEIIKKYSNFVERDIIVNGEKFNNFEAIWLMEPKDVTEEQHDKFFQAISKSYDKPLLKLHYKVCVNLNLTGHCSPPLAKCSRNFRLTSP